MRYKYRTRALVLQRSPLGETSALLTLLTPDLGLVRARAQGVRRRGAKLAASLSTWCESEVVLVRGVESWRVGGAVLARPWFTELAGDARRRAARVCGLLLRLASVESAEPQVFDLMKELMTALTGSPTLHDRAECVAALTLLQALGLDAGPIPEDRTELVVRINRGIKASGL